MKKYIDTEKLFGIYRDYLSYDADQADQYNYWINEKYFLLVSIDDEENLVKEDIILSFFKDFKQDLIHKIGLYNEMLKLNNWLSCKQSKQDINNYIKWIKLLNDSKFEEHIKYRISNCIYVDVEDNCENQTINKGQSR